MSRRAPGSVIVAGRRGSCASAGSPNGSETGTETGFGKPCRCDPKARQRDSDPSPPQPLDQPQEPPPWREAWGECRAHHVDAPVRGVSRGSWYPRRVSDRGQGPIPRLLSRSAIDSLSGTQSIRASVVAVIGRYIDGREDPRGKSYGPKKLGCSPHLVPSPLIAWSSPRRQSTH